MMGQDRYDLPANGFHDLCNDGVSELAVGLGVRHDLGEPIVVTKQGSHLLVEPHEAGRLRRG